jgi:ABC-type uncharacterized transport system auxiliary subunit
MKRLGAFVPLVCIGGCVTLLPEAPPPPRLYALESGEVAPLAGERLDAVLAVAAPNGERAILGGDLIWREGDALSLIGQSQWSNRAEAALQSMLVETIVQQGRFRAAVRQGEARSDFEVRWDVLDFEISGTSMTARFVADVKLLAAPGRRILAQRLVAAEVPVADRTSSASAAALARAAREGSARIGDFVASEAAQASAASISR